MKLKVDKNNVKPCSHMEELVSAYVDGELTGVKKWYTKTHIDGCKQCQASIPFLIAMRARTLNLPVDNAAPTEAACQLDQSKWTKIEESWDGVDGGV